MNTNFDNLRNFFERIKSISFWQRIFSWGPIKSLSYEAYEEFRKVSESLNSLNQKLAESDSRIRDQENRIRTLTDKITDLRTLNEKNENKISGLENEIKRISSEKSELANKLTRLEQSEQTRLEDYQKNVSGVNAIRTSLENERQKLHDDRIREQEEAFERMKQTWQNHEEEVKKAIMNICQAHLIEYVKEVPFKGRPDNTINIAGEYIIFDAKSPAGDDLENFPRYLKVQTESVSKYVKQENVKGDIFLVVPNDTVEVISQFSYRMADYTVYIITIDALEPVILALKRIEEYEFVDQLTPEERENICRIIGKFSHTAKRKIMIDYFFSFQFLDIISKTSLSLPPEIRDKVLEFEKAEKLNPPQEKRAKHILLEDLLSESERLSTEAKARISDDNDRKTRKSD